MRKDRKPMRACAFMLALALLAAGCGGQAGRAKALTDKRTPSPDAREAAKDATDFTAVSTFACELFRRAAGGGAANPVLSPVSAYLCLAMAANGAAGDTLSEFERLLGGDNARVNRLARALTDRLCDVAGGTKLHMAHSAWIDDGATADDAFLQAAADWFDAQVYTADLPSDATRRAVDAWVSEQTEGLIRQMHAENYPDETLFVLFSSICLKAAWEHAFGAHLTGDGTFTAGDGAQTTVPFLHAPEGSLPYIGMDGIEGVLLPYDDAKTAFVALRPADRSDIRAFAASLTPERLAALLGSAGERPVDLSMPKFTVEYETDLNALLQDMGLIEAFDADSADLTRLGTSAAGPENRLYVSKVFQKVKLAVAEEGTEAAAVTEMVVATKGIYMPPESLVTLRLDSPFFYAIVDLASGVPLFAGLLTDPV